MMSAVPPTDVLRRFVLGAASPPEAERVEHWLREHPHSAAALLEPLAVDDSLVETLRAVPADPGGSNPEVEELIQRVATVPPDQAPPTSQRLGGYRLLHVLGRGGMGVVYEAEDERLGRRVALKVMRPELATNAEARERFLREARSAAALEHDHVITIHQVGEEGGVPFLAMPVLRGSSLEERLTSGPPLSWEEVARIGRQVAEGLAAAHGCGLIHRDVKPGNIWLEAQEGRVKLLDFGLVRGQSETSGLTQTGLIVGTPAYMAPEQARGLAVDPRADLFSLGCVLYRLCTGRPPFLGANALAVLASLAIDTPADPRTFRRDCPEGLARLVLHLLEKEPTARPASALAVAAALAELESSGGKTLHYTAPTPPRRRHRRMHVAALLVATSLVVLGGFFGGTALRLVRNEGELVVEVDDSAVEVRVLRDGSAVRERTAERVFLLTSGGGEVEFVDPDGVRLVQKSFDLPRGGRAVVGVAAGELASARRPEALLAAARIALEAQRYEEAEAAAAKAARLDPVTPEAPRLRGESLVRRGLPAAAIAEFTESLRRDPGHLASLVGRRRAALAAGLFDLCVQDCDALLGGRPEKRLAAAALIDRGSAWALQGRFDRAYTDFDDAAKLLPEDGLATLYKGLLLRRQGNEAAARAALEEALRLSPQLRDHDLGRFDRAVPQASPLAEVLRGREVLTVAQDGSGRFRTLQAALDAIGPGQAIRVLDRGPYRECLERWEKPLPTDVVLVSEVGTRIEIPAWRPSLAHERENGERNYHGWRLHASRGLRLSGFEFRCPPPPVGALSAEAVVLAGRHDLVVERCRVIRPTGGPFVALTVTTRPAADRACAFLRWNDVGGGVTFPERPDLVVVEENRIDAPGGDGIHLGEGRGGEVVLRQNVLRAGIGISLRDRDEPARAGVNYRIVNNLLDTEGAPLLVAPPDGRGAVRPVPASVRVQNNLLRSRDRGGILFRRPEELALAWKTWRVGHNGYLTEPGIRAGSYCFPLQASDRVVAGSAAWLDPADARNPRVAADGPLASAGAGGDLPEYIGALPPGTAPRAGDWFSRLAVGARGN